MLPYYLLPIPLGLLAVASYTVWDWQRHRAPIVAENPENHYTLLHHLKVVTLPVFRYRISFVVSRSDKAEIRQLATKFPVTAAATVVTPSKVLTPSSTIRSGQATVTQASSSPRPAVTTSRPTSSAYDYSQDS